MINQYFCLWGFLFSLLVSQASAAVQPVALQFAADAPVHQTYELQISVQQKPEGKLLETKMRQLLEYELSISEHAGEGIGVKPPFDLKIVLQRCRVEVEGGEEPVIYDTADEEQVDRHPVVAQLRRAMFRPMIMRFNENYERIGNVQGLGRVLNEMPGLRSFINEQVFEALFDQHFVLAGRQLRVGEKVERLISVGQQDEANIPLIIEVQTANYKHVQMASIGSANQHEIPVNGEVGGGKFVVTGTSKGTGQWTQRHALIAQMDLQQEYKGTYEKGDIQWPVTIHTTHSVRSQRASAY